MHRCAHAGSRRWSDQQQSLQKSGQSQQSRQPTAGRGDWARAIVKKNMYSNKNESLEGVLSRVACLSLGWLFSRLHIFSLLAFPSPSAWPPTSHAPLRESREWAVAGKEITYGCLDRHSATHHITSKRGVRHGMARHGTQQQHTTSLKSRQHI